MENEVVAIENSIGMVRDIHSKAVISTNVRDLRAAKALRNKVRSDKERISALENEMADVRQLLEKILKEKS